MPYITQDLRKLIAPTLDPLCLFMCRWGNPGVLNYVITRVALAWIGHRPRYEDYNAVIGALECAKLELYRKQIAYYEDAAMVQNGPVVGTAGTVTDA